MSRRTQLAHAINPTLSLAEARQYYEQLTPDQQSLVQTTALGAVAGAAVAGLVWLLSHKGDSNEQR